MVIDSDAVCIAIRVATLKERLMDLYTPQEAHDWIYSPQRLLDGHRPIDIVADILGYLEVDNVIDHLLECTYL